MATVREGAQSALVIVDVQVDVMADAWEASRVIRKIAGVVERARAQRVPVIWVQHQDGDLVAGTAGWAWVPELRPAAGEVLIPKNFNSAFERTELEASLARAGVSHLVLAGAATNWCIRATAYGALERGYDVTLLKDAHTTGAPTTEEGKVLEPGPIVDELNVALAWVEYPGRKNRSVSADEVVFNLP